MRSKTICLSAALLAAMGSTPVVTAQDSEAKILARAKEIERKRIQIMEKVVPAVAAVFPGAVGKGGGSGVIIHPRGYVLTNFHVVKTARRVNIGLSDGVVYKADVLSIDPTGDIALCRIRGKERFNYVALGDSDALTIGERVYAMGNPFLLATDFKPTITEGVVGGVHRFRGSGVNLVYGDCIQTDAAINPGNSGGPLFDAKGHLIGINGLGGFRKERGRFNVGVGYAASINQIKYFLAELRAGGQVQHGTMEATVRDVPNPDDAKTTMAVFDQMFEDSVAYKAGVRIGDQVLEFNGNAVFNQNNFLMELSRLPTGHLVKIKIRRRDEKGKKVSVDMEIGFRLKGLESGPKAGAYKMIPKLASEELKLVLKDFRAGNKGLVSKPAHFARLGKRSLFKDGVKTSTSDLFEAYLNDHFRSEAGKDGKLEVLTYNGKKLQKRDADGALHEIEDDEEAFTAYVIPSTILYCLSRGILDRLEAKIDFEGGELIDGRLCVRLGVTDKAERYTRIYLDMESGQLRGFSCLDEAGDNFVETIFLNFKDVNGVKRPFTIEVRDWESGKVLRRDEFEYYCKVPIDKAWYGDPDAKAKRQKLAPAPVKPKPAPVKPKPVPAPVKPKPLPAPVKPKPVPAPVKPKPLPAPVKPKPVKPKPKPERVPYSR
jgi:S1-C subfamily serine protease